MSFFLTDKVLQLFEEGLWMWMFLIDLQKAFDTTNYIKSYKTVLTTITFIGLSDHITRLFQSDLSNRKIQVNFEGSYSAVATVSWKVLQASILGPLSGAYSERCQTSKMKRFAKRVHGIKPLTIFAKRCLLNVWQGSEYTSICYFLVFIVCYCLFFGFW